MVPLRMLWSQLGPTPCAESNVDTRRLSFRYDSCVTIHRLDQIARNGQTKTMLIYKIFRGSEWADMQENGTTTGAPIDVADGFVHFSGADTVAKTASLYFADMDDLWLIAVEADGMANLVWETSRGGAAFPHLYRELDMTDVVWARPLPLKDGLHQFGDLT